MKPMHTFTIGLMALTSMTLAAQPPAIVRGIYCNPRMALARGPWTSYGKGGEMTATAARTGTTGLLCRTNTLTEASGMVQSIDINQKVARPIVVAGWARLEGIEGPPSYRCSVYVDCRLTNGKSWPMQTAEFDPAKKGWQYAENIYRPPSPVASARVYVFLRQKIGTACFDDVYVGEILDDKGKRSSNLLRAPGFEPLDQKDHGPRKTFFAQLDSMHCNAFHFYRGVGWDRVKEGEALPPIRKNDPLPDFFAAAHQHGFGVWVTVGLGYPAVKNPSSPGFPLYACVNNRWGEAYTRAVCYYARYDIDGIGVVPDEWTFTTGRLKHAYAKNPDPDVAAFYRSLPSYACCPVCKSHFQQQFHEAFPDMASPWKNTDPIWGEVLDFRYRESTAWMRRTVAAAKRVHPGIVTDTMICVLPICSDDRIGAGAAWDMIGAETQLDCLQTDPYILLHNYRGDSTHYYPSETTIHLTAANWPRRAGVTLEASRLRAEYRPLDPAEVYGTALSCLMHGAREFFWWHMRHVTGGSPWVDAKKAKARVTAAYDVMRRMEPAVAATATPGDILVLYSRRSEDIWHWRAGAAKKQGAIVTNEAQAADDGKPARVIDTDIRRGFIAHKNVLMWLMRRGYPFQTTFLEHPDPARTAAAKIVLVPFPLALRETEAHLVLNLAAGGATVILLEELSPLDELGQPLPRARLAACFGKATRSATIPRTAEVGRGRIVFLGRGAATGLFKPIPPQRSRAKRVPLADFAPAASTALEQAIGPTHSLFARQPTQDIEAVLARGPAGNVLLLINWDVSRDAEIVLRPKSLGSANHGTGFRIDAGAAVHPWTWKGPAIRLSPQDAILVRLAP